MPALRLEYSKARNGLTNRLHVSGCCWVGTGHLSTNWSLTHQNSVTAELSCLNAVLVCNEWLAGSFVPYYWLHCRTEIVQTKRHRPLSRDVFLAVVSSVLLVSTCSLAQARWMFGVVSLEGWPTGIWMT